MQEVSKTSERSLFAEYRNIGPIIENGPPLLGNVSSMQNTNRLGLYTTDCQQTKILGQSKCLRTISVVHSPFSTITVMHRFYFFITLQYPHVCIVL